MIPLTPGCHGRLRRFASSIPTVYQSIRNYLFPRDVERVGAYVAFTTKDFSVPLDLAGANFDREIQEIILRLATRRSWPIDQRRSLVPSSIKVYLKTPTGHADPINYYSTLAWSANTVSAQITPMSKLHFWRRVIGDAADAKTALDVELRRLKGSPA